jgi:hypothetical protein
MRGARKVALIVAVAVVGTAAAVPVAAEEVVRPCRVGSPVHVAATQAVAALDADIRKLAPAADPASLMKRIEELGQQTCFRIGGGLSADAKSGLSLRTWWEAGGHAVATGVLAMGGSDPKVWIVPDARRALTREAAPGHRLTPLLCPGADETCGRETDGWRLRAEAALERAARARTPDDGHFRMTLSDWERERAPTFDDCEGYAGKALRRQQLARYRNCLTVAARTAIVFPIGRIRKPTEGWLVVSGRRGHYAFCDEVSAFDLATGAAYHVASCGGLDLTGGGGVDHRATDASRKPERRRGTVSLDEIREAAWMLLQLGELDEDVVTEGFGEALPKGIAVVDDGVGTHGSFGGGHIVTSAQTSLHWRVTGVPRQLGSGRVTWPRDLNDDAEAYATELLEVAEASFSPGCPPATPPGALVGEIDKLCTNRLDADPKSLATAATALSTGWRELLRERCDR